MAESAVRVLAWLVLAVLAWRTVSLMFGFLATLRYFRHAAAPAQRGDDVGFVVFVPLYQEQDHCSGLLDHIAKVWGSDPRLRNVVCATTAREAHAKTIALGQSGALAADLQAAVPLATLLARYGGAFSVTELSRLAQSSQGCTAPELAARVCGAIHERRLTSEVLAGEVRDWNQRLGRELFVVTQDGELRGNRATQVNWAVAGWLSERSADAQGIFLGFFDADSRPARSTLDEVAGAATRGAVAMQQPTLYLKDLWRLPAGLEGAVMVFDALMQTVWSLGFEVPNWRTAWARVARQSHAFLRRSSYGTGHGTWIRSDVWTQLGGLRADVPASGMYLGYELSARNLAFYPLASPDCAEVPIYVRQLVAQHKYWFAGGMQVFRLLDRSEVPGLARSTAWAIGAREALVQVRWLLGPFSVIAALIAGAALGDLGLLAGFVAAIAAHCLLLPYLCWRSLPQLRSMVDCPIAVPRHTAARCLVAGPVRGVVRGLGPSLWLWGWIRRAFVRTPMSFQRTAR